MSPKGEVFAGNHQEVRRVAFPEEPPVTGSDIGSTARAEKRGRSRTVRGVALFVFAVACLVVIAFVAVRSLGNTEQPSHASLACAAKLYSTYDPKNLEQCMAVCMSCNAGVKTTCSTSCTLKGAR